MSQQTWDCLTYVRQDPLIFFNVKLMNYLFIYLLLFSLTFIVFDLFSVSNVLGKSGKEEEKKATK